MSRLSRAALASAATVAVLAPSAAVAAPVPGSGPAAADYYVDAKIAQPLTIKKSAGTVGYSQYPGVYAATKATITVSTFGFVTWKRTWTGNGAEANLPKPAWLLPQVLKADVFFNDVKGVDGVEDGTDIHRVLTKSWTAVR